MQELLAVLITWLAIEFGLPATDSLPRVEFTTEAKMEELRRGAATDEGPRDVTIGVSSGSHTGDGVFAVYDDRSRTLYLPETWDSSNPADTSLLVHELVHHLQAAAGMTFACAAEREKDAYRAQRAWLKMFDTTLEDAFGIDPMTVLVRTNCFY